MDLQIAIETESLDVINTLISKKGFTTDSKWLDYDAVKIAVKYRRKDVVELLLKKNCRVNKPLKTQADTPLHQAVQSGDPVLILCLLKKQASTVTLNAAGNSPLHIAFLQKQEKLVDIILDYMNRNSEFSNPKNSQGLTHLHIACTRNNSNIIAGLLNHGALVNDLISNDSILWAGYNCFHFAAEFKSLIAIKLLLNHKTEDSKQASVQDNFLGKTPLNLINQQLEELSIMSSLMTSRDLSPFHTACTGGNSELLKSFLDNDVEPNKKLYANKFCTSYSSLHFATHSENYENTELLLKYRADADNRNEQEMTPVQLALYNKVTNSNDQIVKILYNATSDKLDQKPDKNGLNFMHVACFVNDLPAVKQFLRNGEDINSKVTYERQILYRYTPLHFAIRNKNLDMAKYLLEHGALVNCGEDCVDGTPLHLACKIGHEEMIDFLLEIGANVRAVRIHDKRTPLHQIIEYCQHFYCKPSIMPYISKLIKSGVDVNAKDVNGDTALHLACEKIYYGTQCVKLLLDNGADINIENESGKTPFDCQLASFYLGNCIQPGDYTILYHHVQMLKTIGFQVDLKNEACCKRLFEKRKFDWNPEALDFEEEELARKQQERIDEIAKMKSIKLTNDVSLYDFVRLEPRKAKDFVTHYTLIEFLQKDFPIYGHLLKLQHQETVDCVEVKVENVTKRRAENEESGGRGTASKRRRSK